MENLIDQTLTPLQAITRMMCDWHLESCHARGELRTAVCVLLREPVCAMLPKNDSNGWLALASRLRAQYPNAVVVASVVKSGADGSGARIATVACDPAGTVEAIVSAWLEGVELSDLPALASWQSGTVPEIAEELLGCTLDESLFRGREPVATFDVDFAAMFVANAVAANEHPPEVIAA